MRGATASVPCRSMWSRSVRSAALHGGRELRSLLVVELRAWVVGAEGDRAIGGIGRIPRIAAVGAAVSRTVRGDLRRPAEVACHRPLTGRGPVRKGDRQDLQRRDPEPARGVVRIAVGLPRIAKLASRSALIGDVIYEPSDYLFHVVCKPS